MAAAVDLDDLDAEEEQAPAPLAPPPDARLSMRPSLGGAATTAAAEDVAKFGEAEQRALQVDAIKTRERLYGSITCGVLLVIVACLLAFVTTKIIMATDPEVSYTHVIRNTHTPFEPVVPTDTNTSGKPNETDFRLAPEVDTLLDSSAAAGGALELPDVPAEGAYFFCATEACKNVAAYLEGLLSPHRDTCSSLYDHVCTAWARSHRHLAESRGHYSVDDAILDAVLEQMGRLLSSPEVPLSEQRDLYSGCIAGHLVSEQDLEDITNDLVLLTEERTPDTLAEVIVRMASIGVSPFFEVFVKDANDTVYVNLVNSGDGATKEHLTTDRESNVIDQPSTDKRDSAAASPSYGRNESTEFLLFLERHMCLKVAHMTGINRTCVLSVNTSKPPGWDYEWYASNGPARLATAVAFMLEDLSAYHKEIEKMISSFTSFRITVAPKRERLVRCLRFIDQYDPDLIPHLVRINLASLLKADAGDMLSQLKKFLYKKMPNASAINLSFDVAGLSKNASFTYPYSDDLYGKETANASRLRRFLERSTWKRWTGSFISKTSALSLTPAFSHNSSTLEVPIGVFNLTTSGDQWLRDLSIARTGPRVFKTLFLGALSPELARTRFFRCISERSKSARYFNERGLWGVIRKVALFAGYGAKNSEFKLDLEELASFYISLQAYRARVGEAVAVPGSLLNSDTLFLLYYVFNNCEVESPGTAGGWLHDTTGHDDRASLGVISRRRRVDSVAAMFGGMLLEKCVTLSDLSSCEVESDDQF
ncbi:hypothetical protein V5799_000525 [Amblyomma americanum]|uniref:Uncharacterized protein n=1 Tax=Amblyomma americanum TaxID=6943 RepID=A0AAQ4D2R7_AMBAM